jgi:toxin ParE1/3/4
VDHYSREGRAAAGSVFTDAIEHALSHAAALPGSGPLRYSHELNLPALRSGPVSPFPHIVFYADLADRLMVSRKFFDVRLAQVWRDQAKIVLLF